VTLSSLVSGPRVWSVDFQILVENDLVY